MGVGRGDSLFHRAGRLADALSLFNGSMMGARKSFFLYAGSTGFDLLTFVLISVPSRLSRFLILSWLIWWIGGKVIS